MHIVSEIEGCAGNILKFWDKMKLVVPEEVRNIMEFVCVHENNNIALNGVEFFFLKHFIDIITCRMTQWSQYIS